MKVLSRPLLGALLLYCTVTQAVPLQSTDSPDQWLAGMVAAGQQAHYTGRSVYMAGAADVISLEVRHAVFDGESWERIIHLSDQQAEILRRGRKVSCLHPNNKTEFSLGQLSSSLQNPFMKENFELPSHYRLVQGGSSRVAGRDVWQLDVLPEDRLRYGYRLWLDQQTGLLLKSVTLDQRGDALELFEFVQIDLEPSLTKADFEPGKALQSQPGDDSRPTGAETRKVALATQPGWPVDWRVGWLPTGFDAADSEMRPLADSQAASRAYSDGLAAFTVFVEPLQQSTAREGSQTHGATLALSRQLSRDQVRYLVTIVGEIPMETALQVAASVMLDSAPARP